MERERKIKVLQAIAAGEATTIGRPLPAVYLKKFGTRKALEDDIKMKYGPQARVIFQKTGAVVVSDRPGMWIFYDEEVDGPFYDGVTMYTREEHADLVKELTSGEFEWIELRPRIISFVQQPGNAPLEDMPDNESTVMPPVVTHRPTPTPAVTPIQQQVEQSEPPQLEEKAIVIRLSTWGQEDAEERRDKMNEWKNINGDLL